MSEMLDRVAIAIAKSLGWDSKPLARKNFRKSAIAALEALRGRRYTSHTTAECGKCL